MAIDLSSLNERQKLAVLHEGRLGLIAGAGSGKTFSVVTKIAKLVLDDDVPPQYILATAFTRKSADEMIDRIKAKIGNKALNLRIGTFHSICNKIYSDLMSQKRPGWRKPDIVNNLERYNFIKKLAKDNRLGNKDVKRILNAISIWKNSCLTPESVRAKMKSIIGTASPQQLTLAGDIFCYEEYEKYLKKKNKRDFDDMLLKTMIALDDPKNADFLKSLRRRIRHVLIDEAQDTNLVQYKILDLLIGGVDGNPNVTLCGDDFQCQTAGTMVEMLGGEKKAIESVSVGDEVVSYDKANSAFTGRSKPCGNIVERIAKRHITENIWKITVDGRSTEATDNHLWYARYHDRSTKWNVVYLMYREGKFRVGWCQMFHVSGTNHLNTRANIEKAEKVWVLSVHDNKKDASLNEKVIAANYGLPLITFEPLGDTYLDTDGISTVFEGLTDHIDKGHKVLAEHGKLFHIPLLSRDERHSKHGSNIYKIATCNIIKEITSLPIYTNDRYAGPNIWKPIESMTSHMHHGYVYSLEIAKNKTYIADGISTHNCIYEFRGSSVSHFRRFIEQYRFNLIKLEQNYRSTKQVVKYGNNLISHNLNQIEKTLFTDNYHGDDATCFTSMDLDDEAQTITQEIEKLVCEDGYNFSDICLVYRLNAQTRAVVDQFVMNNIPHIVHSKFGFYDRKEIKDIISYMKILINPYDANAKDFGRIINKPIRYLGKAAINKIERFMTYEGYETFWEAMRDFHRIDGFRDFEQIALNQFIGDIEAYHSQVHTLHTNELFRLITRNIGYEDYLKEEEIDSDKTGSSEEGDDDKMMNLDALHDGMERFDEPEQFLKYVLSMRKVQNTEEDSVNLMTVHKSKGLEFPVVFVIGMGDRLFPFYKTLEENPRDGIESERRIAYVAITRAKERLYIGAINGKIGRYSCSPSPFIKEMGISRKTERKVSQPIVGLSLEQQGIVSEAP